MSAARGLATGLLALLAIAVAAFLALSRPDPPATSAPGAAIPSDAPSPPAAPRFEGGGEPGESTTTVGSRDAPGAEPPETRGERRIPLAKGGTARGRVVAPDGAPIGGATVETSPAERRATTDEEGKFRLEDLDPGTWLLRATAPERVASEWREVAIEAGSETGEIVFALLDGLAIEGRVRDDAGVPLVGAGVFATTIVTADGWVAETTEEGRFRIPGLPAGTFDLEARLEGHLPARRTGVRAGETEVEIVLPRAAAIRGRVVDEVDRPVSSFRVEVERDLGTYAVEPPRSAEFEHPEGRFAFEALVPGLYHLRASSTSDGDAVATGRLEGIRATPGEESTEVIVRLDRVGSIFGSVRASDGTPIAGASLGLASAMAAGDLGVNWYERHGGGEPVVRSAGDGSFEFDAVPPGVHTVLAHARGRGSAAVEEVAVAPGAPTGPLSIVIPRGGTIEGTVTEAFGEPVPGVAIVVLAVRDVGAPRNARWLQARTDETGAYRVEAVAPGSYMVVRVDEKPGGEAIPAESKTAQVRGGETVVVDFSEEPEGAVLLGSVYEAGGAPASRVQIVVIDFTRTGATIESTYADAEGRYRIAGLDGGLYGIYLTRGISLDSVFLETVSIPSRPLEVRRDLTLPGGAIAGRVRDARTGAPMPRARLALLTDVGAGPAFLAGTGVADDDGAFRFGDLSPRHYRVSATADGYGQEATERFFLADDETRERIDLSLHPGGSLALRVLDPEGKPVARAFVAFRDPEGNTIPIGIPMPWTEADGSFGAEGVKPGRYTAAAVKEGVAVAVGLVEVVEGERTEAVLQGMAAGVALEPPRLPAPR